MWDSRCLNNQMDPKSKECSFLNRFQRILQRRSRFHPLVILRDSILGTLDFEMFLEIFACSVSIWWYCTSTSLCNILKLRSWELLMWPDFPRGAFWIYSLPVRSFATALFDVIFLSCHVLYGHWWKWREVKWNTWGRPSRFYRACFFIRTIILSLPPKIVILLASSISTLPSA